MADDVYVRILKFAKEQGDSFRLGVIKDKFPEQSALIDYEAQHERLFTAVERRFDSEGLFSLSFDDYFRLMEHEELEEARRSSRFAFKVAVISIFISAFSLFASVGISMFGISRVEVTNVDQLQQKPIVKVPESALENKKIIQDTPSTPQQAKPK